MNTELKNAAIIALRDCMGLKPEETLLVITDELKRDIGAALHEAGKELCKESLLVEIKSREINGQEPPKQIADLMKMVDAVICPTAKSLTHTNARREASKLGVRVGTMPGITVDCMVRCLNADIQKILDLTDYVVKRMTGIKQIRVVTEKGTDITMPVEGRNVLPSKGVMLNKGESGNLPSGEVYLAPWEGKTNGTVVVDGSMAGIGMLKTPITIEVVDGYAEKITGGEEAVRLTEMLDKVGRDARAVAEFGIGTNYKAQLTGMILEDEKVFGTIHVAFGNNISMGGNISASSHLDGLVKDPDVYFDDIMIMKKGKMLDFEV
ncbi:MAG TPA: aminopeptidase [Bacteroidales bacterium]|jgi:leucyl aminopeptidase (aminopeptidase T)|nr:aminopeptidase [Bacteroidales bacterium]HNZ42814.1 aminopeptidase [Bacteroidales bacterium]HOH83109.1 aminopeptidase [Bacteroidales bacterium]HPB24999.1 aminopeptidase [Bacteroidales bacterium]HPI30251.1 aminopeptidase [Bacteroidales bacterium]